jgi:alpha-beta hydrolase superfamily lysophospholipase
MSFDDWQQRRSAQVFEQTLLQIQQRRQTDSGFTIGRLDGLLQTEYVNQGNDWVGRGTVEHIVRSATIAAYEVALAEWKQEMALQETTPMRILFLHGFGSDPNGIRPTFLAGQGYEVIHPALPDHDFAESVRVARQAQKQRRPDVVVGSSRGGAVALELDLEEAPLVLIAPAWKNWNPRATVGAKTLILHSEHDDVIPLADSRELLEQSGLPESRLVIAGENHRMVGRAAFQALLEAIERVAAQ